MTSMLNSGPRPDGDATMEPNLARYRAERADREHAGRVLAWLAWGGRVVPRATRASTGSGLRSQTARSGRRGTQTGRCSRSPTSSPRSEPDRETGPTRTGADGGIYHFAPEPAWAAWHAHISALPRGTPGVPEYLHSPRLAVWHAISAYAASISVPRNAVESACHAALRARPRQPWPGRKQ